MNFGKVAISFYTVLLGAVMHVFHCWIFLIKMELEIVGLGIAMVFTQTVVLIGLMAYTYMQKDLKEALIPFDKRAFEDLGVQFKYGVSTYLMLGLEWWVWELMILISGLLGVEQ